MRFILFALFLVGCPDTKELPDFHYGNGDDTSEDVNIHHDTDVTPASYSECVPGIDVSMCKGPTSELIVTSEDTGATGLCSDVAYCDTCSKVLCYTPHGCTDYCEDLYSNLFLCVEYTDLPQGDATPLELTQAAPQCADWEIPADWISPVMR